MDQSRKPGSYSQSYIKGNHHLSGFNEPISSTTDLRNFDHKPKPFLFTDQINYKYCSENKYPVNEMQQTDFRQPKINSSRQMEELYNMRYIKDSLESQNTNDLYEQPSSGYLQEKQCHRNFCNRGRSSFEYCDSRGQNERSYEPRELYVQDHKYHSGKHDFEKEPEMSSYNFPGNKGYYQDLSTKQSSGNSHNNYKRNFGQEPLFKHDVAQQSLLSNAASALSASQHKSNSYDKRNFSQGDVFDYDTVQQPDFHSQQSNAITALPQSGCYNSQNSRKKNSNRIFSRGYRDNNQELNNCQIDQLEHNDDKFNKNSEKKSIKLKELHSAEKPLSNPDNEKRKSHSRSDPSVILKKTSIPHESTEIKSSVVVNKLPKGRSEVQVIWLENPSQLYIQLSSNSLDLEKIQTKLQNTYKDSIFQKEFHFEDGEYCVALFTDQKWYRGKVLSTDLEERVIYFIDYGNFDTVSLKNLRPLKSDFYEFPAQVIKVSLANVRPKGDSWDLQASGFLHGCTFQTQMIVEVVEEGDIPKVLLINPNKNIIINNLMLEYDYAVKEEKIIEKQETIDQIELTKIEVGDNLKIGIPYIVNPSAFWMWNVDSKTSEALAILKDMQDSFCGKPFPRNYVPNVGDIVTTKYSDGIWYRVQVQSVLKNRCNIFYIDYGNQDCVSSEALFPLNPNLSGFPPLAIYCKLNRVQSLIEGAWGEAAIEYFKELVINKKLEAIVISLQNKRFTVELKNHSDQFISDLLIDHGYCVKDEMTLPQQVFSPIKKESSTTVTKKIKSPPKNNHDRSMFNKFQCITLTPGQELTATFQHFESFQEIYIQDASKTTLSSLDDLHSRLSKFCNNLPHKCYLPVVGEVACALFDDNVWYRVRADEILKNQQIKVFFCDYGNSEVLSKTLLRKIITEFCTFPFQAIKCRLTNTPIEDVTTVGPVMEKIMMLLNKPCTIEVISTDNNSYLINMTDPNGFTLNKMLEVSHLKKNSVNVPPENKSYFIDDLDSVTLNVGETYFLIVQCVLNPNLIFCNVSQEKIVELKEFIIRMTEYYSQVPFDANYKPVQAEICAVQFSDQAWYRASILTYDNLDTVKVFYIDFGNIEVQNLKCVRKLHPQFVKLPSQAIHCKLADIVPVNGEDWPLEITDKLENLMPNLSILTAQVKSHNGDHYTIDIIQIDKKPMPINQMLVNLKLARKIL